VTETVDIFLIKIGMNILQPWSHPTFYLLISYHQWYQLGGRANSQGLSSTEKTSLSYLGLIGSFWKLYQIW